MERYYKISKKIGFKNAKFNKYLINLFEIKINLKGRSKNQNFNELS